MEKPATPKAPQEVKPEAPAVAPPPYIPPAAGSPSTGPGGLAIAALIVGIVAILSCFVPFWGLVVGIAAIILGVLALKKPAGKGFGIASIVLGGLGTLINLVVVALFVIALFAAGSIVNEAQQVVNESKSETKTQLGGKEYAVNEPVTKWNRTLTVNSVERNYQTGSEYSQPETGKEYVVVEVTIVNDSSEDISYNGFDFQIQDSNGVQTNEAFLYTLENRLSSGSLAPGGKVNGLLGFEVPKDDNNLKLIYDPTFWENSQAVIKLS